MTLYFEEFFNVNLSFINKTTIKYKISLINFTEVHGKNIVSQLLFSQ